MSEHINSKKSHKLPYGIGTAVAVLLICTIAVTSLSSGFFTATALAADLTIQPTAETAAVQSNDQYPSMYVTTTEIKALELDIFKGQYTNDKGEVTVSGALVTGMDGKEEHTKVIAPGTSNEYTFALVNSENWYMDYRITLNAEVTGIDDDTKKLPVQVKLKGAQGWMLGDETTWASVYDMTDISESAIMDRNGNAIYTLAWQWPFDGDDALDTWLGNHDAPIHLTITITTEAAHHIEDYSDSSAGGGTSRPGTTPPGTQLPPGVVPFQPVIPPIIVPIPDIFEDELHMQYLFGYEDGTVRPQALITRAEVAAILYRLLDAAVCAQYNTTEHNYSDIPYDVWYESCAATLSKMGLYSGYSDGTFRGNQPITRGEFAALLARISTISGFEEILRTEFTDILNHWAEDEIKIAENNNWVVGYGDGTYRPDQCITRAEAVTMINRVLHRTPERYDNIDPSLSKYKDNQDPTKWYYIDILEATSGHNYERLLGNREKWETA